MKYYKMEDIDNYIEQNRISKIEFCNRCRISPKILMRMYADDPTISPRQVNRVMRFMNLLSTEFLTREEYVVLHLDARLEEYCKRKQEQKTEE